jgi:1-deoxy-D-xylulose 5-phosphate reductoisomerase
LDGRIGFTGIGTIVEETLAIGLDGDLATLEGVLTVDQRARQQAHVLVEKGIVFQNG